MKKIIIITGLAISACGAGIYWHLQTTTLTDLNEKRDQELNELENPPVTESNLENLPFDVLLKISIQTSNTELLTRLVEHQQLDINQAGLDSITILNYAILCSKNLSVDAAEKLITFIVKNLGANVNQEDFDENDQSYIPLSFAIDLKIELSILETLIKLGANVNYRSTPSNVSLLEYAFDTDNTKLVAILIAGGANVSNFNNSGNSILTFALIKAKNIQDKPKSIAMIQAILDGLLARETNPDQPNQSRANLIMSAIATAQQLNLDPEFIALLRESREIR